jgi:hypothetical protein
MTGKMRTPQEQITPIVSTVDGMRRIGLVLMLMGALFPLQSITANAGVVDCLSFGIPSVTSSSSSINVSVSVRVNCTKEQIGSARGAVLSIVEEGSFGPTCSGLYSLSPGGFQTISCSIPLTGGFASVRTGATSSTIKVWFAWDFSTKFITFRHSAIPNKSSSGSTSGGSGGTTGGGISSGATTSQVANLTIARFVSVTNLSSSSNIEADGKQSVSLLARVTSANASAVKNFPLYFTISGVGTFSNSEKTLTLLTDANGEAKASVISSQSGQSSISVKANGPGQFSDLFGVVGGVAVSGIKPGVESASVSVAFQPSTESLVNAQEAVDAANEFTDSVEPYGISKEASAALEAANVIAALSANVDEVIASLKRQIELLNEFILRIKAKGN